MLCSQLRTATSGKADLGLFFVPSHEYPHTLTKMGLMLYWTATARAVSHDRSPFFYPNPVPDHSLEIGLSKNDAVAIPFFDTGQ